MRNSAQQCGIYTRKTKVLHSQANTLSAVKLKHSSIPRVCRFFWFLVTGTHLSISRKRKLSRDPAGEVWCYCVIDEWVTERPWKGTGTGLGLGGQASDLFTFLYLPLMLLSLTTSFPTAPNLHGGLFGPGRPGCVSSFPGKLISALVPSPVYQARI